MKKADFIKLIQERINELLATYPKADEGQRRNIAGQMQGLEQAKHMLQLYMRE